MMMMGGSFVGWELVSFTGKIGLTVASCTGAFFTLIFVLGIAGNLRNNIGLLLVGIMIGFMTGAFQSVLEYISSAESLKSFSMWGMGSVGNTNWDDLTFMIPITLVTILYGVKLIKPLNAIQLGDGYATSLGVDVKKIRFTIIIITGILTGITTAFCGPIAFIGIALPHAGRLLLKSADHRYLMPASLLLGASALLLCDIISQLPGTGYILPVNIVTSLIGAPLIIYLILKNRE